MQIIRDIAELDAKIAECEAAQRVSDDALRAVFPGFCMAPPASLPADPFSAAYRVAQMELYEGVAGLRYSTANEATAFSVEDEVLAGFPWRTGSCATAGEYFGGIAALLKVMALPAGSRIIEFGPGWGELTLMLAKLGHRVTAVDVEGRFCELIRRKAQLAGVSVEVVQDDFLWVERAGRQWDAALFFESFHHSAEHMRLLHAVHGALRPGGAVYFGAEPVVPDFPMPWGLRLDGFALWAIRRQGWLELGFRSDYFREALARSGFEPAEHVFGPSAWDRVWQGRRREPLVLSLSAADPRLFSQTGQREGAVIRFAGAPAGTALYGPYLDLPAGRYRARLQFRPGQGGAGRGRMDICVTAGKSILAAMPVDAAALEAGASLGFASGQPLRQVEVRLFNEAGFSGVFDQLDIVSE
jgi:SAM-dependent methyltransferase